MKPILLAFIAGVAAGILLAPDKGARTRKKLKATLADAFDTVTDSLHTGLEELYAEGIAREQDEV